MHIQRRSVDPGPFVDARQTQPLPFTFRAQRRQRMAQRRSLGRHRTLVRPSPANRCGFVGVPLALPVLTWTKAWSVALLTRVQTLLDTWLGSTLTLLC